MCRLTQSYMYTLDKKCSIKINQREIIQKRNIVELRLLCTALRVIARNMHIKFGMIWTHSDQNMLRTRKSDATDDTDDNTANAATADEINPYMSPFQATQKSKNPDECHVIIKKNKVIK